jgi:hypothetical protein
MACDRGVVVKQFKLCKTPLSRFRLAGRGFRRPGGMPRVGLAALVQAAVGKGARATNGAKKGTNQAGEKCGDLKRSKAYCRPHIRVP